MDGIVEGMYLDFHIKFVLAESSRMREPPSPFENNFVVERAMNHECAYC